MRCEALIFFLFLFFIATKSQVVVHHGLPEWINPSWFLKNCHDYDKAAYNISMKANATFFQTSFELWAKNIRGLSYKADISTPPWKTSEFCLLFNIRMKWVASLFATANCESSKSRWCTYNQSTTQLPNSTTPSCTPYYCYTNPGKSCKFTTNALKLGKCLKGVGCIIHCLKLVVNTNQSYWVGQYAGRFDSFYGRYISASLDRRASSVTDSGLHGVHKKQTAIQKMLHMLRGKRGKLLSSRSMSVNMRQLYFDGCTDANRSCISCDSTSIFSPCWDSGECCLCTPFYDFY
eukprot:TRINITY_DN3844_c0_g1_i1.p1 TRINITY_DN3844_c0_g1~~TRINITY_DN3844_c0_g1_i1.p1  ORF type:complete len:311 (-),score=35.47 TRINITY_DN3844_c0_g1_i1:50-922(-)